MIKFFRKIRQKLLTENNFSKYLLYAFGEILLVMVGILLALQVNNWNNSRLERNEEKAILRQLRTEFTSNLIQLNEKIQAKEELMHSAKSLFYQIDHLQSRDKDSTDHHLGRTIPFSTFDPIVNDLASSGNLRLIRSDSLKLLLSLWTSDIVNVQEDELSWKFYRNDFYVPFLVDHYQLRSIRNAALKSGLLSKYLIQNKNQESIQELEEIGVSKHHVNINRLLDHPDFEDHLERALSINKFAHSQSLILKNRIHEILDLLNSELE